MKFKWLNRFLYLDFRNKCKEKVKKSKENTSKENSEHCLRCFKHNHIVILKALLQTACMHHSRCIFKGISQK